MARAKKNAAARETSDISQLRGRDFARFDTGDLREVRDAIVMELRGRKAAASDTMPKLGAKVKVSHGRNEGETGRVLLHLGVGASVVQFKDGPRRIGNNRLQLV